MGEHVLRRPVSLSKRSLNMEHKIPYVDVISDAILASPHRRLTATEIFEHVSAKYGSVKKTDTLKNTIRHTLSRYNVFQKVQRGRLKKPSWWTVDEGALLAASQRDQGQQIEWGSQSIIPIDHTVQAPPTRPTQLCWAPAYWPSGNQRMACFGNGVLTQNAGYKAPLPFPEPSKTGQVRSSGCYNQPDMTGQSCAAAMTAPGLAYSQTPIDVSTRGGQCIVSVEDFAL